MNDKKEIYYKYFNDKILPNIQNIEQYRLNLIRKVFLSSLILFCLGILCAYIFILIMLKGEFNPVLFPVLLFLMYAFFIKSIINFIVVGKRYQERLFTDIFPLFLSPVANFKPWPKNHNTETILESGLFHNFDTQEDEATFFGFYNRTNIILSSSRLTMPVRGSSKPDMFKGTLIQLELEKSINNHVILFSKNEHKYNNYPQVNPHIDELNRYLYVFAKNTNNISFINEEFWKIVQRFGELYTAKGFEFSFKNNIVLIALRQKRPMEFGFLFRSLLRAKNYDDLIERFIVIYDLIDLLNKR